MTLNIDPGGKGATEVGETAVVDGTLKNGGTYDNQGTVVVSLKGGIEILPVSERGGRIVANCDVEATEIGISKNTGRPGSPVTFGATGGKTVFKIDSDKGETIKRYIVTETDIDLSNGSIEIVLEEKLNIGNRG